MKIAFKINVLQSSWSLFFYSQSQTKLRTQTWGSLYMEKCSAKNLRWNKFAMTNNYVDEQIGFLKFWILISNIFWFYLTQTKAIRCYLLILQMIDNYVVQKIFNKKDGNFSNAHHFVVFKSSLFNLMLSKILSSSTARVDFYRLFMAPIDVACASDKNKYRLCIYILLSTVMQILQHSSEA